MNLCGMKIITLTTDFGVADPFVGIMKGVILGIAPDVRMVDLCHEIAPQDVVGGALALEAAAPHFPPGTVHLAVIDPGVGSERAAIAIESERAFYVGPDNGLFELALRGDPLVRAVRLTNPTYHRPPVSPTFHGRDIFAPAAAHLAADVLLESMGEPIDGLVSLNLPHPKRIGDSLEIHVLHVDRFGNLVTDIDGTGLANWLGPRKQTSLRLAIGSSTIRGLSKTYSDALPTALLAYFGSSGHLEIGIRNGSAARVLGVGPGAIVLATA